MGAALLLMGSVVAVATVAIWVFGRKADRQRVARFADRQQLTVDDLWEAHYRDTGIPAAIVADALGMIEGATGIGAGALRPTDRFGDELAPKGGWEFDDGVADLRWALESRKRGASEGIETVGDFVRKWAAVSQS